jgi:dihydrofolate synthase/folylpolyglutamate synthase
MLREAGHRVGLYTSPHLVSVLERFQVEGRPMSETAFAAWVGRLEPLIVELNATFFEVTTAIAFADFAARGVEIAVVEVGLGGRLDSTNAITPLACGVTRIALEHTEYLGTDLKGIGREKAGIAKAGVPFLTTEADDGIRAAMAETAHAADTSLQAVSPALAEGFVLGLGGPHQRSNASLAIALAEALPSRWRPDNEAVRRGLAAARVPGRFDRRGRWIFDVAHNPDGMRALVRALQAQALPRPIIAVVGVLKDKDWRGMLEMLRPVVDEVILTTAPSAPADRVWDAGQTDFGDALGRAQDAGGTALVTGSFHTVGDAMAALRIDPT